jgi:two-component system cell cycle sensor histidine kinase/response regulator CckA
MNHEFNPAALPPSDNADPSARIIPARARRLLVVDDEAPARILASRVFSEAGFEVVTAQSGFECLELYRKRPNWFDLILLDFSMPFMDGAETFRRLRIINPKVVVLLSTGFMAQVENRIERMVAAGLDGVILKPHRPDELLAKVNGILQHVKMSRVGCVASDMATSA